MCEKRVSDDSDIVLWNLGVRYVPNRDTFRIGVISPVSVVTDIKELKDNISTKYELEGVEQRKRYTQDRNWVASVLVKLIFDEYVLPSEITVGHSFY